MIGKTLYFYISVRFLKVLIAMVLGLGFLIVTVDFIEQLRKAANIDDAPLLSLYTVSLLRAPAFIEKAFPFACLFAAMITLTQLNLKMELVVARAAGVSASHFLLPISISAVLVGIFVATVYNPFAIRAFERSEDLSAKVLRQTPRKTSNATKRDYWIKQEDPDGGSSIINAQIARKGGRLLDNVSITRFNKDWQIIERLDAVQAIHRPGTWLLNEVVKIDTSGKNTNIGSMNLETRLTEDELLGISAKPDQVSFYKLRETSKRVEKSGTNGRPYMVQFHSLTALPLFLLAMVIIAATVCLRFVRFGQVGRMIMGGILSGFVLYTITSLITALGSSGVVTPALAAWAPGLVATLFGMSVLLHQEDG
jgi:lipopolysaccharide export system permease protein